MRKANLFVFKCDHGKTCNFIADCPKCARDEIESLRQQLAEANAKVAELESINTFDAKRLRTLTNLLGMSVPESDETLLSCAGTVLGSMRRVIEDMFKTTNDMQAKLAAAEDRVKELEREVSHYAEQAEYWEEKYRSIT